MQSPVAYAVLGWHEAGPKLYLDYRRFAYAGKFVMSSTGKAVARDPTEPADVDVPSDLPDDVRSDPTVVAAAAFNPDRTAPETLWIRYLTVRGDRRGEGIGSRLAALVADRAGERGYERCRIAVNNPFSYEALYKAGFGWTGRTTGLAELVLDRPGPTEPSAYVAGLERFLKEARDDRRDLTEAERTFVEERLRRGRPPARVSTPESVE